MKVRLVLLAVAATSALILRFGDDAHGDERIAWSESRLVGSPEPPLPYRVQRVYPEITFDQPVTIVGLPGRDRNLVLQRNGKLFTFESTPGATEVALAGDVKDFEPELNSALDLTLDPDFERNGWVYLVWKANPYFREDGARVVRFRLTDQPKPRLDSNSRLDIFAWPSGDHAGSTLRFGPDQMLYVTMGDGSGPFPPNELRTAQDLSDVRGSVLRIDVGDASESQPYRVPPDNPFVHMSTARPEIFAFGFRNPWRMDFDPQDGSLYAGDVGWELWEMIHDVRPGGNYGWSLMEGPQPIHADEKSGPGPIIAPEIALSHTESQSITGGLAVRGLSPDSLEGQYVCGDYVSGTIWAARIASPNQDANDKDASPAVRSAKLVDNQRIAETPLAIISFARLDVDDDQIDDIVVLDFGGGVYQLVPNETPDTSDQFPRKLSETGLFASLDPPRYADGVKSLHPAATMWRDGAMGDRALAIPAEETVRTVRNRRFWTFPTGTSLVNTIRREIQTSGDEFRSVPVETQVLLFDGVAWQPYTYRWNEAATEAELVDSSGDVREMKVRDQRFGWRAIKHRFVSRDQCRVCHHKNVPGGISFTPQNLSHQWSDLVDKRYVTPLKNLPRPMVDPADVRQSQESRARSYLEANCAHCHQRGGGGSAAIVLSHHVAPEKMNSIDQPAGQGSFGITGPHSAGAASVIQPGRPERSVLYYRMSTIGSGRMPHLGSDEVDPLGLQLIGDWIAAMPRSTATFPEANSSTVAILRDQRSWLEGGKVPPVPGDANAVVRGVWEAFVPPRDRSRRIGKDASVDDLMTVRGSVTAGRRWFASDASSQCRSCHVAGGVGQKLGPPLDEIASRMNRRQLLEALLNPSATIDEQWATYGVLTDDGRQFAGLKIAEDSDYLSLRSADGKTHRVPQVEIEEVLRQPQSMMPSGLVESMTETELGDLLAYLESLK